MQVKAKPASKFHFNLQLKTPIILGTVPLASYQPPVAPPQEKPVGEINGGTDVPPETGGVQPPSGWNMPPADQNAQPPQPNPPAQSLYPNLRKYQKYFHEHYK